MRVAALKNVSVEGLGNLRKSFEKRGFSVREFDAFKGEFPKLEDFDVLVVLGGPMGVYEDDKYPFLAEEKRLIEGALQEGKGILGICLGCQLLANVLGAPVYRGEWGKEIGWKPIYPQMDLELLFLDEITVFHWHGDTFDLPRDSLRLASSQAYKNQAFRYGNSAVGLQFHLEVTKSDVLNWIEAYKEELEAEGIPQEEVLGKDEFWRNLEGYCDRFADYFVGLIKNSGVE